MVSRWSVVVADDTDDLRLLLGTLLRADGTFDVVGEARNGAEAVEVVAAEQPTAVLLDLAMPVMDGLQAIPELRRRAPDTKIVVLSGFDSAAMAHESLAAGAHAYLQKGVAPANLTATLRDVCGIGAAGSSHRPAGESSEPMGAPADLLAVSAHELRGPVTALLGAATTLDRHWHTTDEVSRRELVRLIKRQGRRLARLVEDLLSASRLESGHLEVDVVDTPLASVIDIAIESCGSPPGIVADRVRSVVVRADPGRLVQVIANLIANAHLHGSPPILVTVVERAEHVEIRVRDHGPGVAPEVVERLFERFSTASPARGGIGLGLFIARGLARSMGGDAWYEATAAGAAFAVSIPRGQPVGP